MCVITETSAAIYGIFFGNIAHRWHAGTFVVKNKIGGNCLRYYVYRKMIADANAGKPAI